MPENAVVHKGVKEGPVVWVDGDGRPLVTISQAMVQGGISGNQVLFHPYGDHEDTHIVFVIEDNPYFTLRTAYALADEAVGQSNGVDYVLAVSTDGGRTFSTLLRNEVLRNGWDTASVDLSPYLNRDVTIKLVASSRGNAAFDWLQVILSLAPQDDW